MRNKISFLFDRKLRCNFAILFVMSVFALFYLAACSKETKVVSVSEENEDVRLDFSVSENSENVFILGFELCKTDPSEEFFDIHSVNVVITGDNGFCGAIDVEANDAVREDGKLFFDLSSYNQYDLKKALGLNLPRDIYLAKGELVPSKFLEERVPEPITKDPAGDDGEYHGGILLPQGSYNICVKVQYENLGEQEIMTSADVLAGGNNEWKRETFKITDGIIGKVYYKADWKAGEYTKWYCVLENEGEPVELNYNGQGCLPLMTTKDGEEVSGVGWLTDGGKPVVWNPGIVFFEEWGTVIEDPGEYQTGFWYVLEIDGESYRGNCLAQVRVR